MSSMTGMNYRCACLMGRFCCVIYTHFMERKLKKTVPFVPAQKLARLKNGLVCMLSKIDKIKSVIFNNVKQMYLNGPDWIYRILAQFAENQAPLFLMTVKRTVRYDSGCFSSTRTVNIGYHGGTIGLEEESFRTGSAFDSNYGLNF